MTEKILYHGHIEKQKIQWFGDLVRTEHNSLPAQIIKYHQAAVSERPNKKVDRKHARHFEQTRI